MWQLVVIDTISFIFCSYKELLKYFDTANRRDIEQQLYEEKTEQQRSSVYLEEYLKLLEEKVCLLQPF